MGYENKIIYTINEIIILRNNFMSLIIVVKIKIRINKSNWKIILRVTRFKINDYDRGTVSQIKFVNIFYLDFKKHKLFTIKYNNKFKFFY